MDDDPLFQLALQDETLAQVALRVIGIDLDTVIGLATPAYLGQTVKQPERPLDSAEMHRNAANILQALAKRYVRDQRRALAED